jgi:protein-S-isoprenylcysteine O-methyltransferase Ste14
MATTLAGGAWAAGAALLVGISGSFGSVAVWGLTGVSALAFLSLGRRSHSEARRRPDPLGIALQLAFLAVLCAAAYDHRHDGWARPSFGVVEAAGLAMIAGGVGLRRRAVAALGSQFTVRLTVGADHRLVRSGPYGIIRHPNYAGLLLVAFGTALALASPLAGAATVLLWLPAMIARIVQEEHLLVRSLGPAYERYAHDTWRLVPGLF